MVNMLVMVRLRRRLEVAASERIDADSSDGFWQKQSRNVAVPRENGACPALHCLALRAVRVFRVTCFGGNRWLFA